MPAANDSNRLPDGVTTHHALELPATCFTAGALRLSGDKAAPKAEHVFIAYQRKSAEPLTHPVTFVFNGTPAWPRADCMSAPSANDTAHANPPPAIRPERESRR